MNYKQKLSYTLLGAGIMLIGMWIGNGINIEAQNNGVFDKITCREIEVVNEEGQTIALIDDAGVGDGVLTLNNKDGKQRVLLSAFDRGGALRLSNKDGKKRVLLGVFDKGGMLMLSNKDDKLGASLGAFDLGGYLRLYNHKGRFRSYTAE